MIRANQKQDDSDQAYVAIKKLNDDASDQGWEAEAKALDEISGLNHDNIISRVAAFTKGRNRYFMFEWADEGNLRDFWQKLPLPSLNAELVKEVLAQLHGLASALHVLHNYNGNGSYRHGDLKPENILRFSNKTALGKLKIADMGLARHHRLATGLRPHRTDTRYGTARYEPPEALTALPNEARSRLYDIWSVGCIILEFIVWLLYGLRGLNKFSEDTKGSFSDEVGFFVIEVAGRRRAAQLHPAVEAWMDYISKDQECAKATAIRDLLEVVKTKLLVVRLPERRESDSEITGPISLTRTTSEMQPGPQRATAEILRDSLNNFWDTAKANPNYWFTGKDRDKTQRPWPVVPNRVADDDLLSPESARQPRDGTLLAPFQKQNVCRVPL